MDASNPVFEGVRTTVGDFKNENIMLKRQDYKFLQDLVQNGRRVLVPERLGEQIAVNKATIDFLVDESMKYGDSGKVNVPLEKTRDRVVVSKYHAQGMEQKQAYVSVKRKFITRPRNRIMVNALAHYCPNAEVNIKKMVFCGGTANGFITRLTKWAHRKPMNVRVALSRDGLDPKDILRERMSVGKLQDWHTPLMELLYKVEVNKTTDAGPPFFQPKHKCFDEVLELLKIVTDHISKGTFEEFLAENPEVMMSHCKNKMDRYEVAKLGVKTRPYWSFSSPIMLLISILCQDFTKALHKFDNTRNRYCSNAYGFSYAHGGGLRMWNWMHDLKEREKKFICYGDDTKLVWKKEGVIYEVNPDFEQMDGSVDKETINVAVDYILECYTRQYGASAFFKFVGEMWKQLACGSEFFCDGTSVHRNETGLMTGVVGTTYFDTVKSVMAYHQFVHQRIDPFDEKKSLDFFRKMGLVIKEGTWTPKAVRMELEEGGIGTEQKFLGVSMVVIKGKYDLEPVPYMDEEDLIMLMGNIRQPVEYKGTADKRRMFDTARGYMVTGTFHHPRLWSACGKIIDETEPDIICQRIQSNSNGERPEFVMLTDEDFVWPSSDGFPTKDFCRDVYLSRDNRLGGEWLHVFPDLKDDLQEFREKREHLRGVKPKGVEELDNTQGEWGTNDDFNFIEDKFRKVTEPRTVFDPSADQEILPGQKFRMPKNIVKYRDRDAESMKTKEDRLAQVVDEVDFIHNQYLKTVLHYGDYWLTKQMLMSRDFVPNAKGFWTRNKDERMLQICDAWPYNARRAFLEDELYKKQKKKDEKGDDEKTQSAGEKSESAPSVQGEPDVRARDIHLLSGGEIRDLAEDKWSSLVPFNGPVDDISWLSAQFGAKGMVLMIATKVLSQSPNPRVQVELKIKSNGRWLGTAVATNAKLAKQKLYAAMAHVIREHDWLAVVAGGGTVLTSESEEEEEVKPIPAPRKPQPAPRKIVTLKTEPERKDPRDYDESDGAVGGHLPETTVEDDDLDLELEDVDISGIPENEDEFDAYMEDLLKE